MNDYKQIIKDIKSLKIQGANNVALSSLKAMNFVVNKAKSDDPETFWKTLQSAKAELFSSRPTEPAMRNALNYVLHDIDLDTDI